MTVVAGLPDADVSSLKGLIRDLKSKKHTRGVVAVAASQRWNAATEFSVDGQAVRVRLAPSVLAIRDALTERRHADWVVILTDRPADDLPAGVVEHLVTNRLMNLDPFPMLRTAFAASQQEFNLLGLSTDAARAVLRELDQVDAPAPGAVLTEDHLFATLAVAKFGLSDFTPHQVALWSMRSAEIGRYDSWSATADPFLIDQLVRWLSSRLGGLGSVFSTVWRTAGPAHLVPLGLVAAVLSDSGKSAAAFPAAADVTTRVRTRLELELGDATLSQQQLAAWGDTATLAVAAADNPAAALTLAESSIVRLQASTLAARSDVLPSALPARIAQFAASVQPAVDGSTDLAADEAWALVSAHRDARVDTAEAPRDVRVGAAALRLLHRLRMPWPQPSSLADWLNVYRTDLSWVDSAINNAFIGADSTALAVVTHRLVTRARTARTALDRGFAQQLASAGAHRESGSGAAVYIEDLLDTVIKPLTVRPPGPTSGLTVTSAPPRSAVLLVIADGMDAATSNSVVADALRRHRPQWQDCLLPDTDGVHTALAALPTVTRFSRCSLLTGALAAGGQNEERTGFAAWLQSNGLRGVGQVLFHKADLDALSKGHALALDVRLAIEDTEKRAVVACVLNDIEDALDRADPIGTTWTTQHFKHLDALLSSAASVGRTVVLLSDHGHVVERREQPGVQRGDQISARYRAAVGVDPATLDPDEILVSGPRVLTDDHRAILAVDEQLRYTRVRAGYHGGATLAEAVIPVSILVNGAIPEHLGLQPAPPATPSWWDYVAPATPPGPVQPVVPPVTASKKSVSRPVQQTDALFDVDPPANGNKRSHSAASVPAHEDSINALVSSELFVGQHNRFGRRLERSAIATVLREAIAGNGVLSLARAGEILGVRPARAAAATQVLAQVLNTDGVVVVAVQGTELVVEVSLMLEQFGVKQ